MMLKVCSKTPCLCQVFGANELVFVCVCSSFTYFFIAYFPPTRSHHVQCLSHNLRLLQYMLVRIVGSYMCGTTCIHSDHLFILAVLSP